MAKNCKRKSCPINNCGKLHTRYVHYDNRGNSQFKSHPSQNADHPEHQKDFISSAEALPPVCQTTQMFKPSCTAICKSLLAFLIPPSGDKRIVRVILDSWSEVPLVRKGVAEDLGLSGKAQI